MTSIYGRWERGYCKRGFRKENISAFCALISLREAWKKLGALGLFTPEGSLPPGQKPDPVRRDRWKEGRRWPTESRPWTAVFSGNDGCRRAENAHASVRHTNELTHVHTHTHAQTHTAGFLRQTEARVQRDTQANYTSAASQRKEGRRTDHRKRERKEKTKQKDSRKSKGKEERKTEKERQWKEKKKGRDREKKGK